VAPWHHGATQGVRSPIKRRKYTYVIREESLAVRIRIRCFVVGTRTDRKIHTSSSALAFN
jgi:hypothetical protein